MLASSWSNSPSSSTQRERMSTQAPSLRYRRSAWSNSVSWTAYVIAASLSHVCSSFSEANRARPLCGEHVAGVRQRATAQTQAAAADAVCEVVAQPLQVHDAVVEVLTPAGRQPRPVSACRHAVLRQRRQRFANFGQRDAEALRHPDERHPAKDVAGVAALVARRAPAGDQPLALVEVKRGDRDAAALGQITGSEVVVVHTTSTIVEVTVARY